MADEQNVDFFQPAEAAPEVPAEAPPADAPILMGPPPAEEPPMDFAAAPAPPEDAGFIGDVDATGGAGAAPAGESGVMMQDAVFVPQPPAEEAPMGFAAAPEDAGAEPIERAAEDADMGAALPEPEPEVPAGPTPMSIWNDEWQVTLKDRKDAENAKKAEVLEQAKADIAAFQAAREAKREARMATNRSDEQEKLEALEADLENDNSWQKVCKLVDLSHDSVEGGADTKKMRDVMIMLKNEPSRATVLSN